MTSTRAKTIATMANTSSSAPRMAAGAARRSRKPLVVDPVKYKTVLCVNYEAKGACPYGKKCQFAHGVTELRERAPQQRDRAGSSAAALEVKLPPQTPVLSATTVCSSCSPARDDLKHDEPPAVPLANTQAAARDELAAFFGDADDSLCAALEQEEVSTPPSVLKFHGALAPMPWVGGSMAACFNANDAKLVPEYSLWQTGGEPDEPSSPLRCNKITGKVEPSMPSEPKVPWVTKRASSATEQVRRSISFLWADGPAEVQRQASRPMMRA